MPNIVGLFSLVITIVAHYRLWENGYELEVMYIDRIKSYCFHFKDLFDNEKRALVHSVYKSTINCLIDDRIISLQHQDMPITPLSINLDIPKKEFELIRVDQGDEVQFTKEGLVAFNSIFAFKDTEIFDCDVNNGTKSLDLVKIGKLVEEILLNIDKGEFGRIAKALKDKQTIPLSYVGKYAFEIMMKMSNSSDVMEISSLSAQLIGVGEGLTPSGDDFNCGMLAALFYLRGHPRSDGLREELIRKIQNRINTTTIISREFLVYACEGKFSQMVKNLLIRSQNDWDVTQEIMSIRDIGHTSGIDFLTGLYFGLLKGGNE